MLKLTIPETPNFYSNLISHPRVVRVVALSGGYTRAEACRRLAENRGMTASFSRALTEDLRKSMDDATFESALARTIDEIFKASVDKS
jgi:fructose-bisphosphate aldolase class I